MANYEDALFNLDNIKDYHFWYVEYVYQFRNAFNNPNNPVVITEIVPAKYEVDARETIQKHGTQITIIDCKKLIDGWVIS